MSSVDRSEIRNQLLSVMTADDLDVLLPFLTQVSLTKGHVLVDAGEGIQHCWFIEAGVVSVVATTEDGNQTEIGMIGPEGLVDVSVVHELERTPLRSSMVSAGCAYRIPTSVLKEALQRSDALRAMLLRYAHGFLIQIAGTTLANASFTVEVRLARWLLMCHDRIGGDELQVTHELLSLMLNVRRAGVTIALQALQTANLVSARRGVVTILDRRGLEACAGDGYGPAERPRAKVSGPALATRQGDGRAGVF
jgi:CRP-like cAMP-binding protein